MSAPSPDRGRVALPRRRVRGAERPAGLRPRRWAFTLALARPDRAAARWPRWSLQAVRAWAWRASARVADRPARAGRARSSASALSLAAARDQRRLRPARRLGAGALPTSPGAALLDAVVDLPFALPTAVAGIALAALYAAQRLDRRPRSRRSASRSPSRRSASSSRSSSSACPSSCAPCSRCSQRPRPRDRGGGGDARRDAGCSTRSARGPAAARCRRSSPASRCAFARGVGEYGSVIFIAGNMPDVSEIAPLLIVIKLEEYDYAGADRRSPRSCWHLLRCCCSLINLLQAWSAPEARRCMSRPAPPRPATASCPNRRRADRLHRRRRGVPRAVPAAAAAASSSPRRCATGLGAFCAALRRARRASPRSG